MKTAGIATALFVLGSLISIAPGTLPAGGLNADVNNATIGDPCPLGDLNGDCITDFKDLTLLAENWLCSGPGPLKPDLSWVKAEYLPLPSNIGDTLHLTGTYRNTSTNVSTSPFQIGWSVCVEVNHGSIETPPLAPGASGEMNIPSASVLVPGSYKVHLTLDPSDQVQESAEYNNSTTLEFNIPLPPADLQNGGFETWGSQTHPEMPIPLYWTVGTGYVSKVPGKTGSAVLLGGKTDADPGAKVRAELYQFITPVYPSLTITFDAFGENPWMSNKTLTARVEVLWYDVKGGPLPATSYSVPRSTDWKSYQFTVNAPTGGVYAKINLVRASWGYVVFDNMVVRSLKPN